MDGNVNIGLVGKEALQEKFYRLKEQVQKRIVNLALKKAAQHVVGDATAAAPCDTGNLVSHITMVKIRGRNGMFGYRVALPGRVELGIAPNAKYYYPAAAEFGTKYQKARPFMRPAIEGNRQALMDMIADVIGKAIEREAKKKA